MQSRTSFPSFSRFSLGETSSSGGEDGDAEEEEEQEFSRPILIPAAPLRKLVRDNSSSSSPPILPAAAVLHLYETTSSSSAEEAAIILPRPIPPYIPPALLLPAYPSSEEEEEEIVPKEKFWNVSSRLKNSSPSSLPVTMEFAPFVSNPTSLSPKMELPCKIEEERAVIIPATLPATMEYVHQRQYYETERFDHPSSAEEEKQQHEGVECSLPLFAAQASWKAVEPTQFPLVEEDVVENSQQDGGTEEDEATSPTMMMRKRATFLVRAPTQSTNAHEISFYEDQRAPASAPAAATPMVTSLEEDMTRTQPLSAFLRQASKQLINKQQQQTPLVVATPAFSTKRRRRDAASATTGVTTMEDEVEDTTPPPNNNSKRAKPMTATPRQASMLRFISKTPRPTAAAAAAVEDDQWFTRH